jgi:hypothetical protein
MIKITIFNNGVFHFGGGPGPLATPTPKYSLEFNYYNMVQGTIILLVFKTIIIYHYNIINANIITKFYIALI